MKTVSNLKYFSSTSFHRTNEYDNQILPLLHQMLQLEELTLSLIVGDQTSFIDGQCHIYSLPYTVHCMHIHSSLFYGGLFRTVRSLYVQDCVRPFEDDFFVRIAQAFPLLNKLTIFNKHKQAKLKQQQNKHESTSSIIEFSHLMILNVAMSCINYAK
ncbi:unnamed protein product [Rotaria socialis]|uniref:Uncharacterized protein n=1 Tax=Rotaria socialis TaxID=392032 RepID=A0A821MRX8_9BILA|nr:unnamed protein product [Rotaria socialis]